MAMYPRGSEWAKWDLHIHTPESIVNGYGDSLYAWEKFLDDIEALPEDFKVIGINDYLFIDGYEKIKHEKENNSRLSNIDLILPVVEFRIQKFAGVDFRDTKRINMHVIFSNELDAETIKSQFLNSLDQSYTLTPGINPELWNGSVNRRSLEELGRKIKNSVPPDRLSDYGSDLVEGFNNLNLDEKQIFELLKRPYFKDKYLIAIGKTEWDKLRWADGSISEKKSIINDAHIVFTSAESVEQYINARNKLKEQGVNHLLLDCSDAHTFSHESQIKDRIGNCFNWIKANPTFEGLRQIIFERFERIKVQDGNPTKDYAKPFFSEITISGTKIFNDSDVMFNKTTLLLNQNLVTIVGGRGTGKSLLLDAVAKTFGNIKNNQRAEDVSIETDDFIVTYQKPDGDYIKYNIQMDNSLDYLHIRQGEVKDIVDPNKPNILDNEVKKLLNLPLEEDVLAFTESEIERIINEIFEIKDWLNYEDSEANQINSLDFNEKKKKEKHDLIETITTEANRDLIDEYVKNVGTINYGKEQKKEVQRLCKDLQSFLLAKNTEIKKLNAHIEDESLKIPLLDFKIQLDSLSSIIDIIDKKVDKLTQENSTIDTEFKNIGINTDVTTLLEQVQDYKNDIDKYDRKIEEIKSRKEELGTKLQIISDIANQIEESHQNYIVQIGEKWIKLRNGRDDWNTEQKELITEILADINITANDVFDSNEFYQQIADSLNLGKFRETQTQKRNDRLEETFRIKCKDNFLSLLKGEEIVNIEGTLRNLAELLDSDLFIKDGKRDFLRKLLLSKHRKKYWNVQSKSMYKGKEIKQLSVGMRGTFYICLKLATDPFTKPFVFDQPEDDLDNNFIMNSLVPIFKKIKKYRQVIIVTHNANLVVNADAEQVIVAKNEDETLSYESGAIENPIIREQICDILEGGESAFTMRERKYGFVDI